MSTSNCHDGSWALDLGPSLTYTPYKPYIYVFSSLEGLDASSHSPFRSLPGKPVVKHKLSPLLLGHTASCRSILRRPFPLLCHWDFKLLHHCTYQSRSRNLFPISIVSLSKP